MAYSGQILGTVRRHRDFLIIIKQANCKTSYSTNKIISRHEFFNSARKNLNYFQRLLNIEFYKTQSQKISVTCYQITEKVYLMVEKIQII